VLDEKESNEQEASSSSEDIAESASNGETDNTALDTGKSNKQFPDCMRFLLHDLGITVSSIKDVYNVLGEGAGKIMCAILLSNVMQSCFSLTPWEKAAFNAS